MARESSEIASEVVSSLTHREEKDNPTENVNYDVHRGRNNLYSMTSLPYDQRDIARQQNDILGPLSLFAPYVHEEEIADEDLTPDRPVTPIDEEIRGPSTTFKQLSRFVLRRIVADKPRPFLEIEDQEALAGVLLGELNAMWTDLQKQADDSSLTKEQNFELKRMMTVRIVDICKNLFYQYVEKAQILNRRGVFTGPANVSRLKSQLGLEAHKHLNVPSIRRWAAEAMLGDRSSEDDDVISDKLVAISTSVGRRSEARKPAVPSVRKSPRRRSPKRKPFTMENEIRDMNSEMPTLRTEKLMSVLEEIDQLRDKPSSKSQSREATSGPATKPSTAARRNVRRSRSLDETNRDDSLADELELHLPTELKRSDSTHLINIPCLMTNAVVEKKPTVKNLLKNDLENLMSRPKEDENQDVSDDMPPLIQAITRSSKHDNKRSKIDQQLEELETKEEVYMSRTKVRPHEKPKYPQPSTVASKLPNKMSVRASDVRVSERVCMSNFTIDTFGPLYNDLSGEVDQLTAKAMDKNLFMGDEIKEVYHEIMKTIPDDHLTLSNDELVLPAADYVNVSSILMPSALGARTHDQIVNTSLQRCQQPPWKKQNVMQWAKTPVTQLRDVKPDSFGSSRKPDAHDVTNIPGMVLSLEEYREQLADCPNQVQERLSRNYQSWLTSWKSTLSTEDYLKYLASQETDYLCYMFHYYDSDGEDTESQRYGLHNAKSYVSLSHQSLSQQSLAGTDVLADRAQLKELKAEKKVYNTGFWNSSTVLLGGLGNDPVPLASERCPTPASDTTQTSYLNLGKRLRLKSDVSQHTTKSGGESELSKTIINKQKASAAEARRRAEASRPKGPTPQQRLEKVWSVLQMPDHLKLDMAIKYSSDNYIGLLNDAIQAWEKATDLIMEREKKMSKLENFERLASDPNRFFEKGFRGSSVARLEEAKQRSYYYKHLDEMETSVRAILTKIETDFQDKVSFQGRVYMDKMHWDRIEMLFWLQEERKQHILEKHNVTRGVQLSLSRKEPSLQQTA